MYDLLVLTLNNTSQNFDFQIQDIYSKALNKHGNDKSKYYYEIWPYINNAYGILFKLFTHDGLGEFECCDEIFEFGSIDEKNIGALNVDMSDICDAVEDFIPIRVKNDFEKVFNDTLRKLLTYSPISTIAILCRGQSNDKEIIRGTFNICTFINKMKAGEIMTNICYIISN